MHHARPWGGPIMNDISKFTGGVDLAKILSQLQIDCPNRSSTIVAHSGFIFIIHKMQSQMISFICEPEEAMQHALQILAASEIAEEQRKNANAD